MLLYFLPLAVVTVDGSINNRTIAWPYHNMMHGWRLTRRTRSAGPWGAGHWSRLVASKHKKRRIQLEWYQPYWTLGRLQSRDYPALLAAAQINDESFQPSPARPINLEDLVTARINAYLTNWVTRGLRGAFNHLVVKPIAGTHGLEFRRLTCKIRTTIATTLTRTKGCQILVYYAESSSLVIESGTLISHQDHSLSISHRPIGLFDLFLPCLTD